MKWLKDNLDKILSVFISLVVGGLVGFFSAILSLKSDIDGLNTKIEVISVRQDDVIAKKLDAIDTNNQKIFDIEIRLTKINENMKNLKARTTELSNQTSSMFLIQYRESLTVRNQ